MDGIIVRGDARSQAIRNGVIEKEKKEGSGNTALCVDMQD